MANKQYAWSTLTTLEGKKVAPGEEVSQSDFTETEEEWKEAYLDTGAVREVPYPKEIAADESPMSYYQRKAQEMSEGNFVSTIEVQRQVESGEGVAAENQEAQSEAQPKTTTQPANKVEEAKK